MLCTESRTSCMQHARVSTLDDDLKLSTTALFLRGCFRDIYYRMYNYRMYRFAHILYAAHPGQQENDLMNDNTLGKRTNENAL